MAGPISQLLDPARIVLELQSVEHNAALEELARTLAGCRDVLQFDGFLEELMARDRLDTTCLGNGIALPHARTEHVRTIVLAVGRSRVGIPFEGSDGPVHLLFMLGTPKGRPGDYLKVLSALCKLLKHPETREAFLSAETPGGFIAAVEAAEARVFVPAAVT